MIKAMLLTFLFSIGLVVLYGQVKPIQFENLQAAQANDVRPVVVLIMTDWCKYCHAMKNSMLSNKQVSGILADKFHTIFLNAEDPKDIRYAGRTFKYKSGINELAKELASIKGKVSYPTLCILNSKNEIIYQHDGYMTPGGIAYALKKLRE